jgi:uncharacterized repeat protein (TIGR01451 family)
VLANGTYTGVLRVQQATAGYGEAANQFQFTIGLGVQSTALPTTTAQPSGFPTPTPTRVVAPTPPPLPPTQPPAPAQPTATPVINSLPNNVQIFKAVSPNEASPAETVRYQITVLNAGSAAATNVRLTDEVPKGLLVDLARSSSSAGGINLAGSTVTVNLGTIQPGQVVTVTITSSVIAQPGSKLSNQARLVYDQTPGGISSNTADLTVSDVGTPAANRTATAVVNRVPTRTPRPGGTITTNNNLPKSGGEFPIMLGLLLGMAILVTRHLRLRNAAATTE